ncbi:MAG TPA: DUF1801 domain-containing protein [Candidatus Acidoferrum sp.]|nr:DUF1801 domain-containing protein [Candidatus Acidoferrum sp.]
MKTKQTPAKNRAVKPKRYGGFTAEEKGAMQDRVQEQKVARGKADGEQDLLAKIAEMPDSDRAMAKRIHAVIKEAAPELSPTTWYGMPAYTKDGKIVCHFQPAQKFKTRYATLGFSDRAKLDDGGLWPVAYALEKLTSAEEAKIGALVKKAVG